MCVFITQYTLATAREPEGPSLVELLPAPSWNTTSSGFLRERAPDTGILPCIFERDAVMHLHIESAGHFFRASCSKALGKPFMTTSGPVSHLFHDTRHLWPLSSCRHTALIGARFVLLGVSFSFSALTAIRLSQIVPSFVAPQVTLPTNLGIELADLSYTRVDASSRAQSSKRTYSDALGVCIVPHIQVCWLFALSTPFS